jgi:peptide subunit release factor 1 (eRF1)
MKYVCPVHDWRIEVDKEDIERSGIPTCPECAEEMEELIDD